MALEPHVIERIFKQIDMKEGDTSACWTWRGALAGRDRRPCIRIDTKLYYVSRVMFEVYHGIDLQPREVVRHKCDNEKCVNPFHLERGSTLQNQEDVLLRQRRKVTDYKLVQQCRAYIGMGWGNTEIARVLDVKVSWVLDLKYNRRHTILPPPIYDANTGDILKWQFDLETGEIFEPILKSQAIDSQE